MDFRTTTFDGRGHHCHGDIPLVGGMPAWIRFPDGTEERHVLRTRDFGGLRPGQPKVDIRYHVEITYRGIGRVVVPLANGFECALVTDEGDAESFRLAVPLAYRAETVQFLAGETILATGDVIDLLHGGTVVRGTVRVREEFGGPAHARFKFATATATFLFQSSEVTIQLQPGTDVFVVPRPL